MTKELTIIDQEKLANLAEEIKGIVSVAHDSVTIEMVAMKYMIGEAIVTNSLYRKHSKSQSELYGSVGELAGIKHTTLIDCVKLYETYPKKNPRKIADELYTKHGAWRNIRAALYGGEMNGVRNIEGIRCKHCPIRGHCLKMRFGIKNNTGEK